MPSGNISVNNKSNKAPGRSAKGGGKTSKASKKVASAGRPVGRTSKVGIQETWVQAFKDNEKNHKGDEAISKYMHSEFPGRDSLVFDRVAGVRAKYNKGGLTGGEVPKTQSRRFGDDGKEVSTRGFDLAPKGGAVPGRSASKLSKKASKKAK